MEHTNTNPSLELKQSREIAGLSQFEAAQKSRIPRMRLSLAECGQVALTKQEVEVLRRVIRRALEERTAILRNTLDSLTHA